VLNTVLSAYYYLGIVRLMYLGAPTSEYAWCGWSYPWEAKPGEHELRCRATDSAGNAQPDTAEWNFDGFCNNAVQRVQVVVR